MLRAARLLACASLLAVSACASTAAPVALRGPAEPPMEQSPSGSAYGLYLAGQVALNQGDNRQAADYFVQSARVSGSPAVREDAFFASVLSGDFDRAMTLAPSADSASAGALDLSRLVKATEALASGKARQAYAILSGEPVGVPHRSAAALLKPWAAAAAGDWAAATAEPKTKSDRLTYALGALTRAQLLERTKRYAEAEAILKEMADQDALGSIFQEAYGQFLERRGREPEAIALYDAVLAKTPNDLGFAAARARAVSGKSPPALPRLREGAGQAMVGAAAGALLQQQTDLSLVYLRLALRLDSGSDEAWILLGDTLAAQDETEEARQAYARVKPASPDYVQARTRTLFTYRGKEDQAAALATARETARLAPDSIVAKTTLADVLRANKAYAESAEILDGLIREEAASPSWRLYYLRALALDKAGRWSDAERDLQAGLALKPDEAEMLNYLGYTWIVRGERLEEALNMIKTAVAAEPNSGAVVDSLGWAYYSLGRYREAVEQLERAAQLEPADPEINTHLGDAYWRVNRRVEAQFQWRKVLATMSPDATLRADLESRLKEGLSPPAAPSKVAHR